MRVSLATEQLKAIQIVVEQNAGYPLCFDALEEYQRWQAIERVCATQPIRNMFCEDCTPEYKTRMMLAKRCSNIAYPVTGD